MRCHIHMSRFSDEAAFIEGAARGGADAPSAEVLRAMTPLARRAVLQHVRDMSQASFDGPR